jgi:hypothetical protein
MFIVRSVSRPPNPFGGAEIQLEPYHSRDLPLLRTKPEGLFSSIYKHVTPNRVKPSHPTDTLSWEDSFTFPE